MLLRGIHKDEIAGTLTMSPSRLESRRTAMLSALTALERGLEPASACG
jgi:hypothetical protein